MCLIDKCKALNDIMKNMMAFSKPVVQALLYLLLYAGEMFVYFCTEFCRTPLNSM